MSVEEADTLYNKIPTVQEMEDFMDKHQDTNDADLVWRLARFAAVLIKTHPDQAKRKTYSIKIKELGEKGLELNPESAGCNKVKPFLLKGNHCIIYLIVFSAFSMCIVL